MTESIYDIVKEAGEAANFSIILNRKAPKASEAARRFGEFAKWCVDNDIKLRAKVGELPVVGQSGYIEFIGEKHTLFILAVPHDIIEVEVQ